MKGIIQDDYLDEMGRLLPKFNGRVYQWMYHYPRGTCPTDAASSPIIRTKDGREFRWTPEEKTYGVLTREESFVPVDGNWEPEALRGI